MKKLLLICFTVLALCACAAPSVIRPGQNLPPSSDDVQKISSLIGKPFYEAFSLLGLKDEDLNEKPMRTPVLRFRKSGRLTEKYPCGVKSDAMVLAMDFTSQSPSAGKIAANKYSQLSMRLFLSGEVPKHLEWIL